MNPGMTIMFDASIVAAAARIFGCTITIFDPSIKTSARSKSPTFESIDRTRPPLSSVMPPRGGCCGIAANARPVKLDFKKSRRDLYMSTSFEGVFADCTGVIYSPPIL
jgi:hypothetical protein